MSYLAALTAAGILMALGPVSAAQADRWVEAAPLHAGPALAGSHTLWAASNGVGKLAVRSGQRNHFRLVGQARVARGRAIRAELAASASVFGLSVSGVAHGLTDNGAHLSEAIFQKRGSAGFGLLTRCRPRGQFPASPSMAATGSTLLYAIPDCTSGAQIVVVGPGATRTIARSVALLRAEGAFAAWLEPTGGTKGATDRDLVVYNLESDREVYRLASESLGYVGSLDVAADGSVVFAERGDAASPGQYRVRWASVNEPVPHETGLARRARYEVKLAAGRIVFVRSTLAANEGGLGEFELGRADLSGAGQVFRRRVGIGFDAQGESIAYSVPGCRGSVIERVAADSDPARAPGSRCRLRVRGRPTLVRGRARLRITCSPLDLGGCPRSVALRWKRGSHWRRIGQARVRAGGIAAIPLSATVRRRIPASGLLLQAVAASTALDGKPATRRTFLRLRPSAGASAQRR